MTVPSPERSAYIILSVLLKTSGMFQNPRTPVDDIYRDLNIRLPEAPSLRRVSLPSVSRPTANEALINSTLCTTCRTLIDDLANLLRLPSESSRRDLGLGTGSVPGSHESHPELQSIETIMHRASQGCRLCLKACSQFDNSSRIWMHFQANNQKAAAKDTLDQRQTGSTYVWISIFPPKNEIYGILEVYLETVDEFKRLEVIGSNDEDVNLV